MLQLEILLKNATLLSESIDLNASIPSSVDKNIENEATENDENVFSPSTMISLPILSRAISINDQSQQELDINCIKSEIYESSANPQYNFSTKFNYNNIEQLLNDLLLSDCLNCNIFLQNNDPPKKGKKDRNDEHIIFGVINMKWKEWILSAIDSKKNNWSYFLPILDPENNTLKKGEIDLEIVFYRKLSENENMDKLSDKTEDEKKEISWKKCCNFMSLIPQKYSYLIINGNNIKSIPNNWWSKNDDNIHHSISISFEVKCSNNYSEKIEINLPLQINDNNDNQQNDMILINKEWMFFIDEFGINYYLNKAQNKQSFDIQIDHIVAEQDKKKGIIKSIKDKFCLSLQLRPFIRPGTCILSQINYDINWMVNKEIAENKKEDTENIDDISSNIELEFRFNDALIEPYIKPIPAASDLIKNSEIRKEHQNANKNEIHIESKSIFQAIIARIQEELKNKYLKICTTYNDMRKEERKEAFMNYLLSSTNGQRLTNIISKIIVDIAKQEMYQESNVITQELTMKLRAKLEKACNPIFEEILNKINNNNKSSLIEDNESIPNITNQIKPFLSSRNIDNIYAEPLRNMDTIKTLIEIAFLNQDYKTANKWIIQAMIICQDKELYCKLYMNLAFVLSQIKDGDISMPYHCIRNILSMTESKEILYIKILMLCDQHKLEEAEPSMNRLLELFPNDPYVQILKGIFEHFMEEIEDAHNIWQQQFDIIQGNKKKEEEEKIEELEYETIDHEEEEEDDKYINNKYDLYDLWIFILKLSLKFDCKQMIKTILTVSKPFFKDNNIDKYKIDFILLQHEVLIYNKKYEIALSKLGEAILMNDNNTRLWLYIGSTYYLLNKLNDSIEAFQRHINECNKQQILPNLMGMFQLIQIYLIVYKNNNSENNNYLKNALSLIEICWNRIENHQIYNNDNLNIFISFENKNNNNNNFINALKYKLWIIKAQYFNIINDTTSTLSYYANASSIHPLDDNLWKQIDKIYNSLQQNNNQSVQN